MEPRSILRGAAMLASREARSHRTDVRARDLANELEGLPATTPGVTIGHIVNVAHDGCAVVEFTGSPGPVKARCAVSEPSVPPLEEISGARVLILFEEGDIARPIIVGFVRERLRAEPESRPGKRAQDCVRASTIVLEGEPVVVL